MCIETMHLQYTFLMQVQIHLQTCICNVIILWLKSVGVFAIFLCMCKCMCIYIYTYLKNPFPKYKQSPRKPGVVGNLHIWNIMISFRVSRAWTNFRGMWLASKKNTVPDGMTGYFWPRHHNRSRQEAIAGLDLTNNPVRQHVFDWRQQA